MKQMSLAAGFEKKSKRTRKREFFDEIDLVVPWQELVTLIESHIPAKATGRPAFAVESMYPLAAAVVQPLGPSCRRGALRYPRLRQDGLEIKIILSGGSIRYLLVKGVDRLLIENFRERNIILDAKPYFYNEMENPKIKNLYNSENLNEYFAKNKLFAIEINHSYGAEIIFSCKIDSFKFCDASGIMSD